MTLLEAETRLSLLKKRSDPSMRNHFHFSPEAGWMNDPNGFCFFRGRFHIFYQYHLTDGHDDPPVVWGHAVSDDLIHFDYLPLALAPDESYDKDGCWSGSAVVKDDVLYLFYTGHVENQDGTHSEAQCLATSTDGVHFSKSEPNPIVPSSLLPSHISHSDFRDPYVFLDEGVYRMVTGTNVNGVPAFAFFSSSDLLHWRFDGPEFQAPGYGHQIECPSIVISDNECAVFFSAQDIKPQGDSFWNVSSSLYAPAKIGAKGLSFLQNPREIDHGLDFYAPLVIKVNGQNIMASWLQMWGRSFPFLKDKNVDSSFGMFREVSLNEEGRLIQKPLPQYDLLFENIEFKGFVLKDGEEIKSDDFRLGLLRFVFDNPSSFSLHLFEHGGKDVLVSYENGTLTFDRSKGSFAYGGNPNDKGKDGIRILRLENLSSLDLYFDTTSLEMFINGGEETMSCLFAEPLSAKGYRFVATSSLKCKLVERPLK